MSDTFGFGESEVRRIIKAVRWVERFGIDAKPRHKRRSRPVPHELIGDVRAVSGATDTILTSDWGKLLDYSNAGTKAITLPQAGLSAGFPQLWWTMVRNTGAGLATITPTTSTIDGAATAKVRVGDATMVFSDGTNYRTQPGVSLLYARKNSGSNVGRRPRFNFIEGAGVTLTVDDDNTNDEVDITIAAATGGLLTACSTGNFDATSTTALANITGLTVDLTVATWQFEVVLFVAAGAVGGTKYAMGGTAVEDTPISVRYEIILVDESTNANTIVSQQTALGGSAGQSGTTAGCCKISGTIKVFTAGTLTVQFAQNVSSGTPSTVYAWSKMSAMSC